MKRRLSTGLAIRGATASATMHDAWMSDHQRPASCQGHRPWRASPHRPYLFDHAVRAATDLHNPVRLYGCAMAELVVAVRVDPATLAAARPTPTGVDSLAADLGDVGNSRHPWGPELLPSAGPREPMTTCNSPFTVPPRLERLASRTEGQPASTVALWRCDDCP